MRRAVTRLSLVLCLGLFGGAACDGDDDDDSGDADDADDNGTCTHLGCFTEQDGGIWHLFGPTPADNPLPGSGATLRRYETRVEAEANLAGLEAGHVYTFWWVFFNAPANCVGTPNDDGDPLCFVADLSNPEEIGMSLVYGLPSPTAGAVADDEGVFAYADPFSYNQGDNTGALEAPFDDGLTASAWDAEIHLIVRDHGPALEGADLDAQLTQYCGGCNDEAEGFCPTGEGPNSCREVAYVRFAPVEEPVPE
jgi:hypothetical protein